MKFAQWYTEQYGRQPQWTSAMDKRYAALRNELAELESTWRARVEWDKRYNTSLKSWFAGNKFTGRKGD